MVKSLILINLLFIKTYTKCKTVDPMLKSSKVFNEFNAALIVAKKVVTSDAEVLRSEAI